MKCIIALLGFCACVAQAEDSYIGKLSMKADGGNDPDGTVGTYKQPHWTDMRSFALSRTYVIPKGEIGLEYWMLNKKDRPDAHNYYLFQKEVEIGIGHRLQLDLYVNDEQGFGSDHLSNEGTQFELRWALADWGEIWGNPTLYFEYHTVTLAYDKGEFRLLLGDGLPSPGRWRWSMNLGYERELYGPLLTQEIAATGGLAKQVCDQLMIGAEVKYELTSTTDTRGRPERETYLGPSLRYRPIRNFNLLVAPGYGLNNDSNRWEIQYIAAVDFD